MVCSLLLYDLSFIIRLRVEDVRIREEEERAVNYPSPENQSFSQQKSAVPQRVHPAGHSMGIVGGSKAMQEVYSVIERVADDDSTILITGETGTGKGLVAKAIHQLSGRRDKAFIQINCGAIPENLLESELFGHVKGAFTGATATRPGKFEIADGGTIFLDEIGDMSLDLQVKILRVLEENQFEPVGGCRTTNVNVRIIAATHRNLEEAVDNGTFRKDLYYRLFVIPIELPSLKERRSDIPMLISHFLEQILERKGRTIEGFASTAMSALMNHDWPGNVRELKNLMERLAVLHTGQTITMDSLPACMRDCVEVDPELDTDIKPVDIPFTQEGICFNTAVSEFEKELILKSLEQANGIKKQAAKLLHLKRTTLVEKMKRYQLDMEQRSVAVSS